MNILELAEWRKRYKRMIQGKFNKQEFVTFVLAFKSEYADLCCHLKDWESLELLRAESFDDVSRIITKAKRNATI